MEKRVVRGRVIRDFLDTRSAVLRFNIHFPPQIECPIGSGGLMGLVAWSIKSLAVAKPEEVLHKGFEVAARKLVRSC